MRVWNTIKAFVLDPFGNEAAAINETMRLPVDYPAVDQSLEVEFDYLVDDKFKSKTVRLKKK